MRVAVSGGDGIDSNGTATMTGGTAVVEAASAAGGGTGAIDINGSFPTGGTLVALGGLSSAPADDSAESWVGATLTTQAEAGQAVAVVDSDGTVVARYVVSQRTSSSLVAARGLTGGETPTLHVGAAESSTGGSAEGLTQAGVVTAGEFTGGFGGHGGGLGGADYGGPAGGPDGGRPPRGQRLAHLTHAIRPQELGADE